MSDEPVEYRLYLALDQRNAVVCTECGKMADCTSLHWHRQFQKDAMMTVIEVICTRCSHVMTQVETDRVWLESLNEILDVLSHANAS